MSNKKKIGIVTITNDRYNFGNRLQNYALQTVLERLGFEVETLNRPIKGNQRNWWKRKKQVLHYVLPYRQQIEHIKAGNFFFWNERHIHWSKWVATDENLPFIAKQYDYFVAGSDQIWNPRFPWGTTPYMFLQFAQPEQRVAYAPSIGIDDEFNTADSNVFREMLQDWRALSCREEAGARIIGNLIGKQVPCLLDPTLLLSREDWQKLTRRCSTPRKYIFLYILGDVTGDYKQYVEELSARTGCQVVDVMHDIHYAGCSPSRFIALIQHTDWVVADSYHAYVFATIFHRPFTFIDRVGWGMNMNSRMDTLVHKLSINIPNWEPTTEIVPTSWSQTDKAIAEEQTRSIAYLMHALQ